MYIYKRLGFFIGLILGTFAFVYTNADEIKNKTTEKKNKKPKADTSKQEVNKSVAFEATVVPNSFANIEIKSLPVAVRQDKVKSVNVQEKAIIPNFSQDKLLDTKPKAINTKTEVIQTIVTEDVKKKMTSLKIGSFRTQDLAEGLVAAPGVADFASWFREVKNSKNATNHTSGLGETTDLELKKEAEAEKLRIQTVESIKQILQTRPSSEQKMDLLMRLAELQIERQRYTLQVEIKSFTEQYDKWKTTANGTEPLFKTSKSDAFLLAGIDALRTVSNEFPNHVRTPEALFYLGFLLTQINSDSSTLYFERLISRFPNSEYVPDSWLALGEHYFAKLNFDKALVSYQKLLNHKNSKAYNYAVYKLGWTFFNMRKANDEDIKKNLAKSLSAFKLVVKLAESYPEDRILQNLKNQSLKDMVLVFADIGDIQSAQAYFDSLKEPELYLTLLERLAGQQAEAGKYTEAVNIYKQLLQEGAMHSRLPLIYAKIPEILEKQNKRDDLIKMLSQMSSSFVADSPWMKKFAKQSKILEEKDLALSKELRAWAEKLHVEGQKTKKERSYDDALSLYTMYLEHYANQADSYSSHFYKAEILVKKGRYLEASDEYMKTALLDEKYALKGKYTKESLNNAVVCLDKTLQNTAQLKLPEAGSATEKIALTPLHMRLVNSLDTFGRLFNSDEAWLEVSHRAAKIMYAFGDYKNSDERWVKIAERYPQSNEIYDGVRLTLKVYLDKKDWDNSIVESRKYLSIKNMQTAKVGEDLYKILKFSIFSKALVLEKADKKQEAAELFMAYYTEFKDDADAPKALFNAANNKFKLGKIDEAISHLKIILTQYSKVELVANAHYLIASSYDALGRFADSASSYEQLVANSPNNIAGPDALYRAAEQRIATGEYENSIKNVQEFLRLYSTHKLAIEVYDIAAKAYLKMNNLDSAIKIYVQGAEFSAKKDFNYSIYLYGNASNIALKNNDKAKALQYSQNALSMWESASDKNRNDIGMTGIRLAGNVVIAILDNNLPELYKKQVSDIVQVVPQFTKIRNEAEQLSQKYLNVAKCGNAEVGVAAMYRLAEIQEFIANVLLNAPISSTIKAEEKEQIKGNLEKIGLPLQEEAAKLYMAAWQKGVETEALTPFMKKIYEKLVLIRPTEFKKVVEEMPAPSYFSSNFIANDETKQILKQ